MNRWRLSFTSATIFFGAAIAVAAAPAGDPFAEQFQPFAVKHCRRCHQGEKVRGEFDLGRYTKAGEVVADFRRWSHVIEFIRDGKMPPDDEPQPTIDERMQAVGILEAILLEEAEKRAGDPGAVPPRRLSNTEYDRSIRDLTGVDIRPTRDFPPDPAGGEGFDNTGEVLGVRPGLLKKYLAAAQTVSEHLVLKTDGITFAPFPVTSYNEQKKLTEQAIIDFYQRQTVRIAEYLEAAWRYRYRDAADKELDIAAWAARSQLSPKYLSLVWQTLEDASRAATDARRATPEAARIMPGFFERLGQLWDAIPAAADPRAQPAPWTELQRFIEFFQRKFPHREGAMIQSHAGNWPIRHLEFRAQEAAARDQFDPGNFRAKATIAFARVNAPQNSPTADKGTTLYLNISRAFDRPSEDGPDLPATPAAEGAPVDAPVVIVRNAIFSKSNSHPRNEDERQKQEVVALRDLLQQHAPETAERLAFGKHPAGGELEATSFAAIVPTTIEIPLNSALLKELHEKQLLLECELDGRSRNDAVLVYPTVGRPGTEKYAANAELLIHPDGDVAQSLSGPARLFCSTFPNRFFYVDPDRGLAAGFHLVEGFFRDDLPLVQKVLDQHQQQELDHLWRELDFVTQSTETLLRGFVWFERAERHVLHDKRFDFLRAEDPELVHEELLAQFEREYLDKLGVKLVEGTLQPQAADKQYDLVHGFFQRIRAGLALHAEQLQAAEQRAVSDIESLAGRAFRRPLRDEQRTALRNLYSDLRNRGNSVESSLRGMLVAVLMSPDFFLHFSHAPMSEQIQPLADEELASRLSYFLWSSLPDAELMSAARRGNLRDASELVRQTRRMLSDPRIDGFAREFFGQWLRYRDYLEKDPINAPAFPGYDNALRQAMFEEPTRFAIDAIQNDRSVLELLHGDATFVNGPLAKHYGGEIAQQYHRLSKDPAEWHLVSGLRMEGRGGMIGMGVILTKLSKGERTSPVKRGFWTVHHLLGQHFPPPPNDVPELPPNEKQAAKTIRELIVAHTENPKCAMCHLHFDGLGMALEGFDPIGRARTRDLADRTIDNRATLPDGKTAQGIAGLIEYIERARRDDFVRTLCRKFLGYALGRSVILSDEPLLKEMKRSLEQNEYRFSAMFETVVRSSQFRNRRGNESSTGTKGN
jgi:hypothetical protein